MKLVVGQRALQGQTVNFPVNTSEVCSLLPKTLDNAGIVLIAPPKTGSSDTSDTPVPQTYFSIQCRCVVRALHWLREHNTLYRDIEIEEVSDDAPLPQTAASEIALDAEGEVIRTDLQLPNIEYSCAPTAACAGCPNQHIQMLKRWPFHGYIQMAQMDLKHLAIHL